jgi:hypothetical protein
VFPFQFCVALISPGGRFYRSAGGEPFYSCCSPVVSPARPRLSFCSAIRSLLRFSLLFVLLDCCESLQGDVGMTLESPDQKT